MAAEPARPKPVLRNGRGHNSERPAYRKTKNKKTVEEQFAECLKGEKQCTLHVQSYLEKRKHGRSYRRKLQGGVGLRGGRGGCRAENQQREGAITFFENGP